MLQKQKVLDHGYVAFVESWGSDERVIEAARMSTDKGFQGWGTVTLCECGAAVTETDALAHRSCGGDRPTKFTTRPGDEKLLKYLYDNKHMTPFEMGGLIIEVQAPLFVFREWHRHRTQSYNELSARYTVMPNINYMPSIERLMINAGTTNKQAGTTKDAKALTEETATTFREDLEASYGAAQVEYERACDMGVPKELARLVIPVGRYSRMRASTNLRNWLGFLTLRMDPAAQYEIRQYANAVGNIIADRFPRTWQLFEAKP